MDSILGYAHARAFLAARRFRQRIAGPSGERGQGTVEYVGLILLVAVLMGGMVAALNGFTNAPGKELAEAITKKILQAVQKVTFK